MDPDTRLLTLRTLAAGIERRGLAAPARILLDAVAPLGFIASQATLMARPFLPAGRWADYIRALSDETAWETLQRILNSREC